MPRIELITVAADKASNKPILRLWAKSHQLIADLIEADTYTVIVPDEEVLDFQSITGQPFQVRPESDFLGFEISSYLHVAMGGNRPERFGWYLQQLLKLEAVRQISERGATAIIWDADTIPLQRLQLFKNGSPLLLQANEGDPHLPYYRHIYKLLGLNRNWGKSFISQVMPVDPRWMKELVRRIQSRHNTEWWKAIIDVTDFKEKAGFSEYEILGSIAWTFFSNDWEWSDAKILRDTKPRGQVPKKDFLKKLRDNGYGLVSLEGRELALKRRFIQLLATLGTEAYSATQWLRRELPGTARRLALAIELASSPPHARNISLLVEASDLRSVKGLAHIRELSDFLHGLGFAVSLEAFEPIESYRERLEIDIGCDRTRIHPGTLERVTSTQRHQIDEDALRRVGLDASAEQLFLLSAPSIADLDHKIWDVSLPISLPENKIRQIVACVSRSVLSIQEASIDELKSLRPVKFLVSGLSLEDSRVIEVVERMNQVGDSVCIVAIAPRTFAFRRKLRSLKLKQFSARNFNFFVPKLSQRES